VTPSTEPEGRNETPETAGSSPAPGATDAAELAAYRTMFGSVVAEHEFWPEGFGVGASWAQDSHNWAEPDEIGQIIAACRRCQFETLVEAALAWRKESLDQRYADNSRAVHVETHSRYVAFGGCASVHRSKAWCNGRAVRGAGHVHFAGGDYGMHRIAWTDDEADTCPCLNR
jgi:hypothetical protein